LPHQQRAEEADDDAEDDAAKDLEDDRDHDLAQGDVVTLHCRVIDWHSWGIHTAIFCHGCHFLAK
jgi:hypothetical protein